jgi:hypothetical protein
VYPVSFSNTGCKYAISPESFTEVVVDIWITLFTGSFLQAAAENNRPTQISNKAKRFISSPKKVFVGAASNFASEVH